MSHFLYTRVPFQLMRGKGQLACGVYVCACAC